MELRQHIGPLTYVLIIPVICCVLLFFVVLGYGLRCGDCVFVCRVLNEFDDAQNVKVFVVGWVVVFAFCCAFQI